MESTVSVTPLDTTLNSPIDCDQHGRYVLSSLPTEGGGEIEFIHKTKLVKTENSREALESEKEHLQAKDREECSQINYNRDYFQCKESKCDSSSQDDKEGVQQWTLSSSCILPCSNNEHDRHTVVTNDMLSKLSANSGPVTHLDTLVCVDTAPVNTFSYIAMLLSNQNEEDSARSTPPPPIVIQPEPVDLIYQVKEEKNDLSKRAGRKNIDTNTSRNSQLQDCEASLVNNDSCVSVQQQLDTIPFKCTVCGRGFTYTNHLKQHNQIHRGEGTFTCNVCAKVFTSKMDLTTHSPTHTSQKHTEECPGYCSVCGKWFATSSILRNHQVTHRGDGPFTCSVCSKVFTTRLELTTHLPSHTPHECSDCGKRFAYLNQLTKHMGTHPVEKPYTVSGKEYAESSLLKQHKQTRSAEKPFKCDVCGREFKHRYHLDSHQRTHMGESRYKCTVCGQGFAHSGNLTAHHYTHSAEKRKDFNQKTNLTNHCLTHEITYSCNVCDRHFATLPSLVKHHLTHTQEDSM